MNKITSLLVLVPFLPAIAYAQQEIRYTYLELDYVNLDIDSYDDNQSVLEDISDGDGWGIKGSYGFTERWLIFGGYSTTTSDVSFVDDSDQFFRADTDIKRFDLGLGYHMPLSPRSDILFRGAYADVDVGNFYFGASNSDSLRDLNDDSTDGYLFDAALLSQLTPRVEGSIGARYSDIGSVDNFSIFGNVMFEISSLVGVNLGIDAGDELSTWILGIRFNF